MTLALWILLAVALITITTVFGADSRDGADGCCGSGRRQPHRNAWW